MQCFIDLFVFSYQLCNGTGKFAVSLCVRVDVVAFECGGCQYIEEYIIGERNIIPLCDLLIKSRHLQREPDPGDSDKDNLCTPLLCGFDHAVDIAYSYLLGNLLKQVVAAVADNDEVRLMFRKQKSQSRGPFPAEFAGHA